MSRTEGADQKCAGCTVGGRSEMSRMYCRRQIRGEQDGGDLSEMNRMEESDQRSAG